MLRFMVIGDWGRPYHPGQQLLAHRMGLLAQATPLDFIISTGDNFYDAGVTGTDDPRWQTSFERVYDVDSLRVPWYAVLGNHDYDGNVAAQLAYSRLSTRWRMPERYYHFSRTVADREVLFVFTDTSPFISDYLLTNPKPAVIAQDSIRQLAWLEQTLASSQAHWKIVVGHHPLYSSSPFHGNSPELIATFEPLFARYGVDVYLCGHEHDLQWHRPGGNTHYLVSGAGSEVRETGRQPFTRFSASVLGIAQLTLEDDVLTVAFVDHQGKVLYREPIAKEVSELSYS